MGQPEIPIATLLPILGLAVLRPIRCDDATLELNVINVEAVIVCECTEPDIFRVVFPVGLRASSLFSLPSDPVSDMKVAIQNGKHEIRGLPIATDVK